MTTAGRARGDAAADEVDEAVRERPWLQTAAQLGWVAKGLVYFLFGATAMQIARQQQTDDEASTTGALTQILDQPGGRVLLAVMLVGIALYFLWRVLSIVVIRGNDLSAWAHRVGYGFSAVFYAALAYTAARLVMRGSGSGDDNTVERVSRSLMESTWGRVVVIVAGVVTVAVGLYFIIHKGLMRSFEDNLHGKRSDDVDSAIIAAGVAGWIGRGVVTILVGYFVARSAITFDPDEARGFDAALREAATASIGEILVWISAIGLMLYGAFCVFSHRYRRIEDDS